MGDISVKVVFDKTFDLKKALGIAPRRLIKKLCFDTEAEAKRLVTEKKAVDTGALRASIYTSLSSYDGNYAEHKAEAESKAAAGSRKVKGGGKRPKGSKRGPARKITILPEAKPSSALEGVVGVGVEYAINVELGTVKQPARPYLLPAAEKVSAEAVKVAEQLWGEEVGKI